MRGGVAALQLLQTFPPTAEGLCFVSKGFIVDLAASQQEFFSDGRKLGEGARTDRCGTGEMCLVVRLL